MNIMEMIKNIETVVEYSWEMFCTSKFVGEVGLFIFLWYQFFRICVPKIVKIGWYFIELFKKNLKGRLSGDVFLGHM